MRYGDVVQITAKGQVVNALVARSIEIAPHSPADGKPVEGAVAEEHLDLIYLDPKAANHKGGPMMSVREKRHVAAGLYEAVAMLLLAFMLTALPMKAQTVRLLWATDYAQSNIASQQANTYNWSLGAAPGAGSCVAYPANGASPYFIFGPTAHPYPQFIRDYTTTLNEVFTPSATSLTGSSCGFSGSPTNSHTTFWVSSGTAGLYEAVGTSSGLSSVSNVMLDRAWYAALGALPGPQVANTVITSTAVPGSAHVQIVDTTTSPWTWYTWGGTQYAVAGVGTTPTLAGVNTFTAVNSFRNAVTNFGAVSATTGTLVFYNANAAFTTTVTTGTPTGSYVLTIPALSAGDTIATLGLANTFSGANTFSAATTNFGVSGTTTGILKINSVTATGSVSLTPASAASNYTATLPANTGTIAELNLAQTFTAAITISPTASLTLGTAGSAVGQAIFNNATSGSITVAPPTGALGTPTMTLPIYSGGVPVVLSCGSTGTGNATCTPTAVNGKQQSYVGESTLSSNSATITFPNTYTSTTSYFCVANDVTTRANPVQMVPALGNTATITNTTGGSDVIQWFCIGH